MKYTKNLLFYILAFFIVIGILSGMFQTSSNAMQNVTYKNLVQTVEKTKDSNAVLYEKSDGTLLFVSGNKTYTTQVNPANNNVDSLIKNYNIKYHYIQQNSGLLSGIGTWILLGLGFFFIMGFLNQRNQGVGKANDMVKENTEAKDVPTTKMEDVGGLSEETKQDVLQNIEILKYKKEAIELGVRPIKGMILYGPPGTGKTLLAKAIANNIHANFYSMSGSGFVEMFVGVGAKRVRKLFEDARKNKPSVIFIDEIDAIAGKRGTSIRNEERESTLNEILTQFDGVESNDDIFIIAATNRIDMLDPAILRPGRFDAKIYIGLPDVEGRKEIINIHTKNKKLSKDVKEKLDLIAESTAQFSGADIEALFNNAAKNALKRKKYEVEMVDINHAIDISILGNSNRKLYDKETKERVAHHEAGHALVGIVTKPKSVRKATIIPRGEALGYVAPILKEIEMKTEEDLIKQIAMTLAGGVAERKIYGQHSYGVSGDVEQAKNIIEKMVELGMKKGEFVLTFTEKEKQDEMQRIYNEALKKCEEVFDEYEEEFKTLAQALLTKETISGDEIESIVFHLPEPKIKEEIKEENKEKKIVVKKEIIKKEKKEKLELQLDKEPLA